MERLNDIINHSTSRRAQQRERLIQRPERATQEEQTNSRPLPVRRLAPEQRQNPAPRNPYASQEGYPPSRAQGPRRMPSPSRPEPVQPVPPPQPAPRPYGTPGAHHQQSPLSRQRIADYAQRQYQQEEQEVQEERYSARAAYSIPSHTFYYHTDDAIPTIESDVLEEEDEEEQVERQQQQIYYTTWEEEYGDGEVEAEPYSPPGPRGRSADTLSTYQPRTYEASTRPPQPSAQRPEERSLRNTRPINSQPPLLPPARPEARTRETRPQETQPREPDSYNTQPYASRMPDILPRTRITQPLTPSRTASGTRVREVPAAPAVQQRPQRPVIQHPVYIQPDAPEASTFVVPLARPACPKCHGAGYLRANVPYGHPNFGKPIACICKENERKEKRRQQLREMSNMDAFQDSTFTNFNPRVPGVKEAYESALAYARNPSGWLVLIGPNGCGKTHLAASIANQCMEDGMVVLFAVVPDLLDHLRAAFAPTATEVYDQLFSKMREAGVLILDDLGAQQSSPWANEKLFQLLNYRYNEGLPTVVTANAKGLNGMDERIRSRLGDVALVESISLNAQDYRPKHGRS